MTEIISTKKGILRIVEHNYDEFETPEPPTFRAPKHCRAIEVMKPRDNGSKQGITALQASIDHWEIERAALYEGRGGR